MSLPDPPAPGKSRHLWLILPFGLVGLFVVGLSVAWSLASREAARRIDATREAWRQAGYELSWKDRAIGGFPFRMDVTLTDVAVRDAASGWALQAPRIEGEAYMHALTHWLIAAPAGISFVRPEGGPVTVQGDLIRASLSHFDSRPPSLSFEGVKLRFAPAPGARPFALTSADRVEFHLRAGPDDEGGVFARLEGGHARLSGLFARVVDNKPIAMEWNSTLSKMSAFSGPNWPAAVRRWAGAGGQMTVRHAGITAGEALVNVPSGTLAAASNGRLSGTLKVSLRRAPRTFDALSAEHVVSPEAAQSATAVAQARQGAGDSAEATIDFQAGRTTFGPVSLGAAPKVYDPR